MNEIREDFKYKGKVCPNIIEMDDLLKERMVDFELPPM